MQAQYNLPIQQALHVSEHFGRPKRSLLTHGSVLHGFLGPGYREAACAPGL